MNCIMQKRASNFFLQFWSEAFYFTINSYRITYIHVKLEISEETNIVFV
jgi:hypothetical protein